jgi:tetratricopeptide (TPR) repeat protein
VLNAWLGDNAKGAQLLRSSLEHSESLGDARLKGEALWWIGIVLMWGPTPVDEALEECRRLARASGPGQLPLSELLVIQGTLLALTGDFAQGRQLAAEGRRILLELGHKVDYASVAQPAAIIELLAGDAATAERLLREAHDILEAAGERGYLSTVSALLALALARQERYAEAEVFADKSRRIGADDDVITQIYWRVAKAQVVASRSELAEAGRLATETTKLVTDYDSFDGPIATVEVAPFLEAKAAKDALERALAGASAKGNVVTAEQARAMLAALP